MRRFGQPFQSGRTDSLAEIDAYLKDSPLIRNPSSGPHPAATHVETKLAWSMRQQGVTHAYVVINHLDGPRTGVYSCTAAVGAILPKGSSLTVWFKGASGELEGITFLGRAQMEISMILSVSFRGAWLYPENKDQISRMVDDVIAGMRSTENVWFCLASQRQNDWEPVAGSNLCVAINLRSGYGSHIWCVDEGYPIRGGNYDSVWISDNANPPNFDPEVISDPGYPLFHDPASTLPISKVRLTVNEFCAAGTGDRPECIDWTAGHANGQRLDRPSITEFGEDPDIDWSDL